MSRVINFVQDRTKREERQDTQDKRLLKKVALGLVVCVGFFLLVSGVRVFFTVRLSLAERAYAQSSQGLENFQEGQAQFNQFIEKVTVLTEVFGDRRNKQEALAFFRTLFNEGVSISGLNYDDEDKELTFSLTAKSVFVLETVIKRLDSPEIRRRYPNIQRESLRREGSGEYTLNITVSL